MTLSIALAITVAITIPFVDKKIEQTESYEKSFAIPAESKTFDLPDGLRFIASESGGDIHLELEEGSWLPLYNDSIPINGSVKIDHEILPGVSVKGTIELAA